MTLFEKFNGLNVSGMVATGKDGIKLYRSPLTANKAAAKATEEGFVCKVVVNGRHERRTHKKFGQPKSWGDSFGINQTAGKLTKKPRGCSPRSKHFTFTLGEKRYENYNTDPASNQTHCRHARV